jgi:DNA-binding response OmpR family regulator
MIQKGGTDKFDSVILNQDRALSPPNQPFYRDGNLLVDLRDRVVILDRQILTLTRMEYRLLALLVEHAGEVVTRPTLLMLTPMVDAHLWRLREKLGIYANWCIETVVGVGYHFRPAPRP